MWKAFGVALLFSGAPYADRAVVGLFPPEVKGLAKGLDLLVSDGVLDGFEMVPVPDDHAMGVAAFWDWYRKGVA